METNNPSKQKTNTIILAAAIGFAIGFITACCILMLAYRYTTKPKKNVKPRVTAVTRHYNGIDVSHHQKTINWDTVGHYYGDSLDFVYIKATEGKTHVDELFQFNIEKARKAGFHVGAYHYFSMKSGAHEQFANFRTQLDKTDFDLIPMVDVELNPRNNTEKKQLQDSLEVFLGLVKKQYGVDPIIYGTNKSINQCCTPRFNNYLYYVGRYGSNPPVITQGDYAIWQYSEKGKLKGIPKTVDLCKFHPDHSIDELLMPDSARKH